MKWLRQIATALPSMFAKRKRTNKKEEDEVDLPMVDARTRYAITLVSFLFLSIVFSLSFYSAFISIDDNVRAELFLEFAKDISYVLGVVVTSYIGAESVFPSRGRRYGGWNNRWRNDDHHMGYGGKMGYVPEQKKEEDSQSYPPPEGDEQVD